MRRSVTPRCGCHVHHCEHERRCLGRGSPRRRRLTEDVRTPNSVKSRRGLTHTQDLAGGFAVEGTALRLTTESATPHPDAADPARGEAAARCGSSVRPLSVPTDPEYFLAEICVGKRLLCRAFGGGGTGAMLGERSARGGNPHMQALLAVHRATGFAAGLAKGVVLFTLRRARTVKRTLFSSSTLSTQLALLAINLCFLYAGASRPPVVCVA